MFLSILMVFIYFFDRSFAKPEKYIKMPPPQAAVTWQPDGSICQVERSDVQPPSRRTARNTGLGRGAASKSNDPRRFVSDVLECCWTSPWQMDPSGATCYCCWGGVIFIYIFSGFAIDRSKKYIKIIENYMKIDAVDPQAAADNPPPPPGNNG